jgi:hypothetical protein
VKGTNPTEKAAQEKASKNWGKREAVSSIEWAQIRVDFSPSQGVIMKTPTIRRSCDED